MRKLKWLLVGCALLLPVDRAAAQLAWDAPWLVPPGPVPGFGVFLMDAYGGDLGVMGMWRSPAGRYGLRGGIAESAHDEIGGFGGIDFSGRITRASYEFPLDVDWVFGAGLGVADWVRVSVPFGINMGRTFRDGQAAFTPYFTPRVIFDAAFDDDDDDGRRDDDDSDADLEFAADIGLDLRFTRGFLVRFGGTLGRDAVAVGVVF